MSSGSGRIKVIAGGGGALDHLLVSLASAPFVPTGSQTVPFDYVEIDPLGMWDAPNTRAVIPAGKGGSWSVSFSLGEQSNTGGIVYEASAHTNAAVSDLQAVGVTIAGPANMTFSNTRLFALAAGDWVDVRIGPGGVNVITVDNDGSVSFLSMVRIA